MAFRGMAERSWPLMGITIQDGLVMAAFAHYNLYFLIYYDSKTWVILIRSQELLLIVLFHLCGKIFRTV